MAYTRRCRGCGKKVALFGGVLIDPVATRTGNAIVLGDVVHILTDADLDGPLRTRPRFQVHLDTNPDCRKMEGAAKSAMVGVCVYCNERVRLDAKGVWKLVTGWSQNRAKGGTNAIYDRREQGVYACDVCMKLRKMEVKKHISRDQEVMFS